MLPFCISRARILVKSHVTHLREKGNDKNEKYVHVKAEEGNVSET